MKNIERHWERKKFFTFCRGRGGCNQTLKIANLANMSVPSVDGLYDSHCCVEGDDNTKNF